MGGSFDEASNISSCSYYEKEITKLSVIPDGYKEAARNRRLLYWSMRDEGFANFHTEWWHYDWGTQMWVMNRGKDEETEESEELAWYGYIQPRRH